MSGAEHFIQTTPVRKFIVSCVKTTGAGDMITVRQDVVYAASIDFAENVYKALYVMAADRSYIVSEVLM